jgi:4-hydroxy-4-methyl-2-oxoglutarate aldolase
VDSVIQPNGNKEARVGGENSWVIDILQPGDVLIVDLFGKIRYGTFAGDNLSTAIYSKSHNGLVVNGAVRDVSGIQQIKGFQVYVRGVDPSALEGTMLMGINSPIRIGDVTVMPGDVALGDPEGITFIPAQLAEKVADDTELVHLVDEWGHAMLRQGRYTPGQIDQKWSREMVEAFNQWLKQKGSKLRMPLP